MSTYKRYFLTLCVIGAIFFVLGILLKENLKFHHVILLLFAVCFYVVSMSLILAQQASIVEMKVNRLNEIEIEEIEIISREKCNRSNKKVEEERISFSMKNNFSAWLTNPIQIENYESYSLIKVPNAFKKYFEQYTI